MHQNCNEKWNNMKYDDFFEIHNFYFVEFRQYNRPFARVNPCSFHWHFFTAKGHENSLEKHNNNNKKRKL